MRNQWTEGKTDRRSDRWIDSDVSFIWEDRYNRELSKVFFCCFRSLRLAYIYRIIFINRVDVISAWVKTNNLSYESKLLKLLRHLNAFVKQAFTSRSADLWLTWSDSKSPTTRSGARLPSRSVPPDKLHPKLWNVRGPGSSMPKSPQVVTGLSFGKSLAQMTWWLGRKLFLAALIWW